MCVLNDSVYTREIQVFLTYQRCLSRGILNFKAAYVYLITTFPPLDGAVLNYLPPMLSHFLHSFLAVVLSEEFQ